MSVLIGREQELNTLKKALHAARGSVGCCILLTGEAGIGKSRLIEELRQWATSENFTILEGYCFEQAVSFPYAPWIDALRAFFGSLNALDIEELLGPLAPELMKLLPELALLLPQIQPTPPLEPLAEKYRLFESFTRFGSSLSTIDPVLFILEDLHWSDAVSLELFQYFVRRIHNQPLMLVGTYRNAEPSLPLTRLLSELNRERLIQEIRLKSLNRDEVEQMARTALETQHQISASFVDAAMAFTDGNPFFVEEVLKSLIEEGHIDELLQQKTLNELQVPHSIQRMVQGRVEQFPEMTRNVLISASVIGQRFDFGLLQEITVQDEQELLQALKESIRANLVIQESVDQFAFKHALTRDAVYAMLMLRESKALHQTVGEALEHSVGTRTDAAAAELAYHFSRAGVWQKAMEYSQRAGEQAQALYAPREAITHFTHALDAAQQLVIPTPLSSLRGRAHSRELLGDFDGSRADDEAILNLARQSTNRVDEWQSLIDLGFLWQSRDLERAGEYYQQALEFARTFGDSSILAQTLNRVGNWHVNRGHALEALPFHQEALSLFRALNDRHGIARTMDLLAIVSNQLGELVQGMAYLQQAIPILREVDNRQALVNTLTNLASLANFDTEVLGELNYRQLADMSEEALQIAHGFNWDQGEVRALIPGASSLCQTGDYARALEWLNRAEIITEAIGHRELVARLQLTFGQVLIGLLDFTAARRHLESGLALVQELGSGLLILAATARLATVLVRQNDLVRAKELMDTSLPAEYPEGRMTMPLRGLWSGRAELELAEGNPHRALEIVERLLASTVNLAQYGPHAVPYLSRLHARALALTGRMQDAETELQGTLPVALRQGQRPMLWRLHADLGGVYRAMGRRTDAVREFSTARTIIQELANNVPDAALRDHFVKQTLATIPVAPALTTRRIAKKEFGGLTAREREIAVLVAQGKSNREIADELVISETTVERHIANIFSKLGFNSRTQIAVWTVEKGLGR
ncbi:MAG TPA: AAA family ATPase [Anaerolineales bacterium]|nr:AAA family ATPase [Anaerolineales bacterium]